MKKKILIILIILAAIIAIRFSPLGQMFTFENLVAQADKLQNYTKANFTLSVILFILIYTLSVSLSLPGAAVLTLTGGFLFGVIKGVIFVNISATAGAAIIFLISRYLAGDYLQKKYSKYLGKFNSELQKNGVYYLLTLRLIPIFPFFLINIMAGLSKIRMSIFVWTTALGIIPGSFVYCIAGKRIGELSSIKDIFTKETFLVIILLGFFALVPVIISKTKKTK
jgi:uncharacterized membrane protein YdjX (TVP38/TMEM64 family)